MADKPCSVKDFLSDPNNIFTMHEMVNKIIKNLLNSFFIFIFLFLF
jgi:hypothetical protein